MSRRWRNLAYLSWVRSMSCVHCLTRAEPREAHHVKGVGGFSGAGLKAPDFLAVPLCRQCHAEVHAGQIDKHEQYAWIVHTLHAALTMAPQQHLDAIADAIAEPF